MRGGRFVSNRWDWIRRHFVECLVVGAAAVVVGVIAESTEGGEVGQGTGDPSSSPDGAPRMVSAAGQLAYARGLKRSMAGHRGEDLARRRDLAIEAYRAVRVFHPEAKSLGAEAAFRAGELLRAADRSPEALREFTRAASLGRKTPFLARARLEAGHIHRREGRRETALHAYLEVAADSLAAAEHRDDAWLWAGCMWQELGRRKEARRAWRSVAGGAASPMDRILAFDHLVQSWIDVGDLEAAAGVLDECIAALSELALEETHAGNRVRKALSRMGSVSALQRAIERRASEEDSVRTSHTKEEQCRDTSPNPPRGAFAEPHHPVFEVRFRLDRGTDHSSNRKGTPRKP